MNKTIICIAEDRLSEEIPIKLLILSLTTHCPNIQIILTFPLATDDFKHWLLKFEHVELRTSYLSGAYGWNVKPQALLLLLEEYDEVWWVDSDIILTCDFRSKLKPLSSSTLVICEEALTASSRKDGGERAKNWGFDIGRSFPSVLNTGVLRVTRIHISLLQRWQELLESEIYKQAQQKPSEERAFHMLGDQDVLTALLSSREFAHIPISLLRRDKHILQYFGPRDYQIRDRLSNLLFGLPPFIHSMGHKPWRLPKQQNSTIDLKLYHLPIWLELSPYNCIAIQYRGQIGETTTWLDYSSGFGIALKILGLGKTCLIGLPVTCLYNAVSFIRTIKIAK